MSLDYHRLITDFAGYYAPNLLKVKDERDRIVPFILREEQLKLDRILEYSIKRHRTFIYILKARQFGGSLWAEGRIFHRTHMYPNCVTAIMAHDTKGSDNVFNMSKRFYDNLPPEYRPTLGYSNKKELVFENQSKDTKFVEPGLGSRIVVFTAGAKSGMRSFNAGAIHLSEFAYYPDPKEIVISVNPILNDVPGNFCILETTANGMDNYAYDLWEIYKEEFKKYGYDSEHIPVFIPWHEVKKYSKPFSNPQQKKELEATLDPEEIELKERFNLTLEQLNWRRNEIAGFGGDVDGFRQEFPSTAEEAFVSSGRPVFDRQKISTLLIHVKEPIFTGEIDHQGRLLDLKIGRLKIWEHPQPGKEYIISVDPKGDSDRESSDECAIEVIEVDELVQVAEWIGMVDPISLVPYIRALGYRYGNPNISGGQALVVVERNNSGLSVLYELSKDYYNIYQLESFDEGTYKQTNRLGWSTDVRTKPLMIDFAKFCFHSDYCRVNSRHLLNEMSRFSYTSPTSKKAEGKNYQDGAVMAWMIGLFIAGRGRTTFVKQELTNFIPEEPRKTRAELLGGLQLAEIDVDKLDPEFWLDTPSYMVTDWRML